MSLEPNRARREASMMSYFFHAGTHFPCRRGSMSSTAAVAPEGPNDCSSRSTCGLDTHTDRVLSLSLSLLQAAV